MEEDEKMRFIRKNYTQLHHKMLKYSNEVERFGKYKASLTEEEAKKMSEMMHLLEATYTDLAKLRVLFDHLKFRFQKQNGIVLMIVCNDLGNEVTFPISVEEFEAIIK